MIRRALDWLGSARRENDEVNADVLRIADLEQTLASVRGDLARAIQGNAAWAAKFAEITAEIQRAAPLVAYALKRKAAVKKYQSKGKRMEWEDKFFTEYVNVGEK